MKYISTIIKKKFALNLRRFALFFIIIVASTQSHAQHPHEMQHGFVLSIDDKFASHLVASGHHSRQAEITGEIFIDDLHEMAIYRERKVASKGSSYFLFQAQNLDLPSLREGQVLIGYIVESKLGNYEPKNIIVKKATYKIEKVLLNILNPFFL